MFIAGRDPHIFDTKIECGKFVEILKLHDDHSEFCIQF